MLYKKTEIQDLAVNSKTNQVNKDYLYYENPYSLVHTVATCPNSQQVKRKDHHCYLCRVTQRFYQIVHFKETALVV